MQQNLFMMLAATPRRFFARLHFESMYLLDLIRRRKFARRYRAALSIFLAAYTYSVLESDQRKQVDDGVYKYLANTPSWSSAATFRRFYSPSAKAAYHAVVMSGLSIPPAIEAESWNIPKKRWWQLFDAAPIDLLRDYRIFDPATQKAKAYLASKGVDFSVLEL